MEQIYDLIIIGSGPAGLGAAIYAKRAELKTLVIEREMMSGGQVLTTYEVDNYAGLPGIGGFDLGMKFREHADKLGVEFAKDTVLKIEDADLADENEVLEAEEAGAKVEVLKAMGGAANSHLWTQIKSDVTGKTMEVPSSDTATTLGAALLAGVGVGMYESFEEAVEKTVNKGRVHTPNVEHKEIHEKNYETYRALYEQLKSLMKKTGGKKQ